MHHNGMQHNDMQNNDMQHYNLWPYFTWNNATHHNLWHYFTWNNATHHNFQHNNFSAAPSKSFFSCYKGIMMVTVTFTKCHYTEVSSCSSVMILSVVAPIFCRVKKKKLYFFKTSSNYEKLTIIFKISGEVSYLEFIFQ